ncbi:hypothetical protein [Moorena sp. SIO3A2]|uniref:hypothetical protein n=1 Tax=Moorena sp. SIO3A2 TaxID=2607841 RepID=UPI0013B969FD|nr:hypothetical protein [Moorena sp. SIO3A2]NER90314.1 hypothetical protein [Moorena sp. SIO3A2]
MPRFVYGQPQYIKGYKVEYFMTVFADFLVPHLEGDEREHPRFEPFDKSGEIYRIKCSGTQFGFGDNKAVTTLVTDHYQGVVNNSEDRSKYLRLNQVLGAMDNRIFRFRVLPVNLESGLIVVDSSTEMERRLADFDYLKYLYEINPGDCIGFEYLDNISIQEMGYKSVKEWADFETST